MAEPEIGDKSRMGVQERDSEEEEALRIQKTLGLLTALPKTELALHKLKDVLTLEYQLT